jgi:hypothetical protein
MWIAQDTLDESVAPSRSETPSKRNMKILTVKNVVKAAAIVACMSGSVAFAAGTPAPDPITSPVHLSDPWVIGTMDPVNISGDAGNSVADDASRIQFLLDLTSNGSQPDSFGRVYNTDTAATYGGILDPNGTGGGSTSVPAGFDLVLAKYGNGAIVFYLGGNATTLPTSSLEFTFTGNGDNGNNFSSWRAYDATPGNPIVPPEGFPTPDGGATMLLLGGGVSALAFLRRKLS